MKDKLRELAERLSERIGGEPITTITSKEVCELLAILDAEGDGGAVDRDVLAAGVRARNIEITRQQRAGEPNNEDHALRIGIAAALASHPARSGVVSDEDVRDAAVAYSKRATDGSRDVNFHDCIRAALEHFAKGERHER